MWHWAMPGSTRSDGNVVFPAAWEALPEANQLFQVSLDNKFADLKAVSIFYSEVVHKGLEFLALHIFFTDFLSYY